MKKKQQRKNKIWQKPDSFFISKALKNDRKKGKRKRKVYY